NAQICANRKRKHVLDIAATTTQVGGCQTHRNRMVGQQDLYFDPHLLSNRSSPLVGHHFASLKLRNSTPTRRVGKSLSIAMSQMQRLSFNGVKRSGAGEVARH